MRLYADQLSRPAQPGSSVVFSAGGTGAGKTTALNMFSYLIQNAEIVMDTTMSDYYWSTKLIDQALNSGRRVTVMYVYRDPVDAFANGVLLYGAFSNNASRVTSKWGLLVEGESFNKMSGALQVVGAVNTSTSFTVSAIAVTNGASMDSNAIMLGNSTVNTVITSTSLKAHTYYVANATGMFSIGLANASIFQSSNATHIGNLGFSSGLRLGTSTVNSYVNFEELRIANSTVVTAIGREQILATNANTSIKSLSVGGATMGTAGEIRALNNITAFAPSDKKFKENVEDIKGAVDIVSQIGGKTFDWTQDYIDERGGEDGYFVVKKDFGVIAQDVEKAFPLAVRTRQDGTLAVDYEKLSALAFAAIVELKQEIEELKNGNKG
jgi:hypothetical protein